MIIDWPIEKWEKLRDNCADVSCWFMGFEAAKGKDENYYRPPGLKNLEDAINEIGSRIKDAKK